MNLPQVKHIAELQLNVADLGRACGFYVNALGFERIADAVAGRARLRLGAQEVVLAQAPPDAATYPQPRAANDLWFQHFAIAVADMELAYAHLRPHLREAISREGPERLPPSTGSVTAFKFRDPDGHPLELSFAPASAWAKAAGAHGPLFQGIDHSALVVRDLEASLAFYTEMGLLPGPRFLNQGPEQDRLDGLDGVKLDIAVLFTPEPGPHLELLHYRRTGEPTLKGVERFDIAATETVFGVSAPPTLSTIRDPDGHRLTFAEAAG